MSPDEYLEWVTEPAKMVCAGYDLPAAVVIVQGALESGWGNKKIGEFNLFGRKAVEGDKSIQVWTREYGDENSYTADDTHIYLGDGWWRILADFKVYGSLDQAIDDWCILITQEPCYAPALQTWQDTRDVEQFVMVLAPIYATKQDYADDIMQTIRACELA